MAGRGEMLVVDDQDEPVLVVAVLHPDVDTSIGHLPAERPQLTGCALVEPQQNHLADGADIQAGLRQRAPGGVPVIDKEVRDAGAGVPEHPASLQADAFVTQDLAELGERPRSIL